jgi:hypothetical protein
MQIHRSNRSVVVCEDDEDEDEDEDEGDDEDDAQSHASGVAGGPPDNNDEVAIMVSSSDDEPEPAVAAAPAAGTMPDTGVARDRRSVGAAGVAHGPGYTARRQKCKRPRREQLSRPPAREAVVIELSDFVPQHAANTAGAWGGSEFDGSAQSESGAEEDGAGHSGTEEFVLEGDEEGGEGEAAKIPWGLDQRFSMHTPGQFRQHLLLGEYDPWSA